MVSVVINEPQQLWALVEMEHLALLIMSVCLRHRRSPPGDALSPTPMHYSVVENKHHPFTAICKNSWNSSRRNYRLTIYQESWTAWNGNIYCDVYVVETICCALSTCYGLMGNFGQSFTDFLKYPPSSRFV